MLASFAGIAVSMKPMGLHAGVWGLATTFLTVALASTTKKEL